MKSNEMTRIAMSVAAILAGGTAIYIFSSRLMFPGLKYALMTPYFALFFAIIDTALELKYIYLKVNMVFGLIMTFINVYMGLSIVLVGILVWLLETTFTRKSKIRTQFLCASYSALTVGVALVVSIILLSMPYISVLYVLSLVMLTFFLGWAFSELGIKIGKRVKRNITK